MTKRNVFEKVALILIAMLIFIGGYVIHNRFFTKDMSEDDFQVYEEIATTIYHGGVEQLSLVSIPTEVNYSVTEEAITVSGPFYEKVILTNLQEDNVSLERYYGNIEKLRDNIGVGSASVVIIFLWGAVLKGLRKDPN